MISSQLPLLLYHSPATGGYTVLPLLLPLLEQRQRQQWWQIWCSGLQRDSSSRISFGMMHAYVVQNS